MMYGQTLALTAPALFLQTGSVRVWVRNDEQVFKESFQHSIALMQSMNADSDKSPSEQVMMSDARDTQIGTA